MKIKLKISKEAIKKKLVLLAKIVGLTSFYLVLLVVSVFFTMKTLIKGEELEAPDLVGKSVKEVEVIAAKHDVYLKKIVGNYDRHYKPLTVINQTPAAGVRIKEKSYITIFVTSDLVEVIMPDLSGYNLTDCEKILRDNDLRKRYVSYMDAKDAPVDFVIVQSQPPGARVPSGTEVDILVSRGSREKSYIMPDLIAKRVDYVKDYFEDLGLKISITTAPYPGRGPGWVIKQFPLSGHRINRKARISIEVSE
ncbi:MAG: PASTA domain-containing protein [Candidatus Aminicenantes bacterium]|nr:PASTA domain-containing protein [Candidatus Aminicenantes bacterium]NIM81854.1 PASTA domain-containing protein [Candidatus Aminicenantes bacterium]NIN21231.1 PASTA domain-containing protein [Candidatus Aminicenantes bacterium]NIN45052.1 PASTA domain-containing protein [Candidatus Aminicenantes bacterium]NIN87869.1 PASTA domain-containing protein [Candidatus Aminicenantes bacterium]